MLGKGWISGSDIISKPIMDEQTREEFDRIFKHGKYSQNPSREEIYDEMLEQNGNIPTGRE